MITIAYNTFSQLRPNSTSYFSFDNKLNFTFAYNIMFIFMAYAFCFYILVYRYLARSAAHGLLNFSKFGFCGFFVESCCRISRNLIKGSIHSYFLQNPKTQLACLLASDILFFIFSIHLTKSFKHKITRILYISYYLFFLIFDLVLYLYYFTSLNKSS